MSLKKYFKKVAAIYIAISMLYSNCYMCGAGLIRVIAQDIKEPAIKLNLENVQYVQFKEEIEQELQENEEQEVEENSEQEQEPQILYNTGVAVKTKLQVGLDEQERILPIKSAEFVISLPALNGIMPERANMVLANTFLSTGEKDKQINQNYDSNSGLLTMSFENESAYANYNNESKDEFEIIYIYPAEAYTGNEEEIVLQYSVNSKIAFETESGIVITSEQTQGFELSEKDNKGNILEFSVTELENLIYKGYMYSNVENETNYETEFNTVASLSVLNNSMTDNLEMKIKENKFISKEDDAKIPTDGKVIYKSTELTREQFNKLLGQDGIIEIFNGEELLATVKNLDVSENDEIVKKLAVIYSDENINILADEENVIKIEYADNITNLLIKTTKPVAEGYLKFRNKNIIVPSTDYIIDVKDIKSIDTTLVVDEVKKSTELLLLEPETKISVNSSNVNFSTLQNNSTTLTINLDSTNISTKLFNNPTLEIKLPEGLVGGNVSSPSIVNGNGLQLKEEVKQGESSNIIILELEGQQTTYDLNNVTGGTTIVMDIENLDYDDTIPAHEDSIEVTCIQGKEKVTAKQNINMVSKAGLLMLSKVSGHNLNDTVVNINGGIQEIQIANDSERKEIHQELVLVNNYGTDLENFELVGQIGYSDSELESTMDANLIKEIKVNKDAQVYYSTNKYAVADDESWTLDFNKDAKAFKIVLDDAKLLKEENAFIDMYYEVPEQIGYNQVIAIKTQVNFTHNNNFIQEANIVKMVTPEVEYIEEEQIESVENFDKVEKLDLEVGVSILSAGEIIDTETKVDEGEILKYNIVVRNNTQEKLSNINLKTEIKNASYYEIDIVGSASGNLITGYVEKEVDDLIRNHSIELEPGENKLIEYQIIVNEKVNNVENLITISKDDEILYENNIINKVNRTNIKLKVESVFNEEYLIYTGNRLAFLVDVSNISGERMKNVKVSCELPTELSFDIENWKENCFPSEEDAFDSIQQVGNTLYFKINELDIDQTKTIYIRAKAESFDMNIPQRDVSLVVKAEHDRNTYISNTLVKTIYQNETKLVSNLTPITSVDNTLKNGDEIVFKLALKNFGVLSIKDAIAKIEVSSGIKLKEYVNSINNQTVPLANESSVEIKDIKLEYQDLVEYTFYGTINTEEVLADEIKIYGDLYDGIDELITFEPIVYSVETIENIVEEEIIEKDVSEETGNIYYDNEIEDTDEIGEFEQESIEDKMIEYEFRPIKFVGDNEETENELTPEQILEEQKIEQEVKEKLKEEKLREKQEETVNKQETSLYTISGFAWQDLNKDGIRTKKETLEQGMNVSLINMEKGNYVLDSKGNRVITQTDKDGKYTFDNVEQGSYAVMFEFDTNEYTVSTYKKEGVEKTENSDAILSKVIIDGQTKQVAITDKVQLNSDIENLDIGLMQNPVFDLNLDKKITKITVVDVEGTKEYTYKKGHTAKVDLFDEYMNGAKVLVNYKFIITNDGEVTGYVDNLVDSLPSGLEFNSEINKNWYKGSDNQLYTNALAGTPIKPGESIEIELVLTKTMTEESTGTFVNTAKLEKISNLDNIQEKEDAIEGNEASAILIISIKTGSVVLCVGITLICLAIIAAGAYLINKKVLKREI